MVKLLAAHTISIPRIILLFVLFIFLNFFEEKSFANGNSPNDNNVKNLIETFVDAVNSGSKENMENFIKTHYDQNVLKRAPLSMIAGLNMVFYYESCGMGYKLINFNTENENQINALLFNNFTERNINFQIPISSNTEINWFIKNSPTLSADESIIKKLSDDDIIERLNIILNLLEKDEEFSGAVLIGKDGNTVYKRAIGEANKSYSILNNIDTKFNIASVGKMFTGVAITQLVEQGKLSFEDTLNSYLGSDWLNPEVSKKIQIKHLLTHTSGLGDYFKDAYTQSKVPVFRELSDYKSLITDDVLEFEPGSKFSYSNTGMLLLGAVIENITKLNYFDYLKKNIFAPSGMLNSGGFFKDRPVKNRATGYSKIYEEGKINWDNHQFTRIMRGSASGGVYSTVGDLYKFDKAIRANKLLSEKNTELLYEGHPELNTSFHSYAFFINNNNAGRILNHKGDGRGMNCQFKMYLDSGYTFIVLSNYSAPSANIVANVFEQLVEY